jgi:hypothetical protein
MPAPSVVALPTAVVVEPGLGLGVVEVVHPAQNTATASETTTTKLATTVFFIFVPLSYFSECPTKYTHLIISIPARAQDIQKGFHISASAPSPVEAFVILVIPLQRPTPSHLTFSAIETYKLPGFVRSWLTD